MGKGQRQEEESNNKTQEDKIYKIKQEIKKKTPNRDRKQCDSTFKNVNLNGKIVFVG